MVTEYNVFLSCGSSQLQQLLPSMSTLDTVVGGSFPVEARLLETGLQLVVVLGVGKGRVMLAVPCVMLPVSWVSICLSSHLWVW